MSALFPADWLSDTAAAVTLLIALVLAVRCLVARTFGPQFAYALWLLPLTRAVLPGMTFTIEVPGPSAATPGAFAAPPSTGLAPPAEAAFDWALLLLLIWLTGAILLSGHALLAYVRLRRAVAADCSLIDIRNRIAIVQSGAVDGPVALGLFRPLVVLPRDFNAVFTPLQQRQVVAHELEHHRGGDLAINLAAFALLALNWFNPIAWAGWAAFRQDQEAACDARTLDRLGARTGDDRATYGRAIAVAVAGPVFRPAPARTSAFALAMGGKSALIHRLRSLTMTEITPRRRWLGRSTLAAAALIALPLTASVSYAVVQADPAPPTPPAPPAAPQAPGTPTAPLPPAPPEIDMPAGHGEHVRRIERDGRTIILRTDRALSDADVERMVADAEVSLPHRERSASASTDGTARRDVHRIVIRSHGAADAAMPAPPVPPVPPVPPADGERRVERRIIVLQDATDAVRCAGDADRQVIERRGGDGRTIRTVRCVEGSAAFRLSAVRNARESMARMTDAHMPAEARRSALAELDSLIAELEREASN